MNRIHHKFKYDEWHKKLVTWVVSGILRYLQQLNVIRACDFSWWDHCSLQSYLKSALHFCYKLLSKLVDSLKSTHRPPSPCSLHQSGKGTVRKHTSTEPSHLEQLPEHADFPDLLKLLLLPLFPLSVSLLLPSSACTAPQKTASSHSWAYGPTYCFPYKHLSLPAALGMNHSLRELQLSLQGHLFPPCYVPWNSLFSCRALFI